MSLDDITRRRMAQWILDQHPDQDEREQFLVKISQQLTEETVREIKKYIFQESQRRKRELERRVNRDKVI